MSGVGFDMQDVNKAQPGYPAISRAILFIIPSIAITAISIILFSQLKGLSETQMNIFSVTIISAVIISLIGMAAMQLLIYRIMDDPVYFKEGATFRAIKLGIGYSLIFSLISSAILYPCFTMLLGFSITDYSYFVVLLSMYSAIWIFSSAFWASEKYVYPAIIFGISYIAILVFTLVAYQIDHAYTIIGYSFGTAVLLVLSWIISIVVFRGPESAPKFRDDLSKMLSLASHNGAAILFGIFYVVAIFLDKIIVWVYQGVDSGQGLLVTGNYSEGAFLGLIPMFSITVMAYFTRRTKSLSNERYNGTYSEIQKRVLDYKAIYWSSIRAMLIVALVIFALVTLFSFYFISDREILKVIVTTSIGAIFFSVIVFNSVVLPIFGKTSISTIAVLTIIIVEIISIPFVDINVWYASIGFLVGSIAGFLISMTATVRLFFRFEYNMFRFLLHPN